VPRLLKRFSRYHHGCILLSSRELNLVLIYLLRTFPTLTYDVGERAARVAFAYSKTMYAMDVLDAKYDAKNLFLLEFAEALVRCAFSKRRDILENEPDDAGGGLSPTAVAEQLVEIIKSMKAVVSAKK